jgi:hypothetical protein
MTAAALAVTILSPANAFANEAAAFEKAQLRSQVGARLAGE